MEKQVAVYDQVVLPCPLGTGWRIWWKSGKATSFSLAVSIDDGRTWAPLSTVPFDINGANYKKGQFFYDDTDGESRYVYSIVAVGDAGASETKYAFSPADEPDMCVIHGYVMQPGGIPDTEADVTIEVLGPSFVEAPGAISNNEEAVLMVKAEYVDKPDQNGHWQKSLPRLSKVRVSVPSAGFSRLFIVPDEAGPKNIRDIPPLPQASYQGAWDKSDSPRAEILHA